MISNRSHNASKQNSPDYSATNDGKEYQIDASNIFQVRMHADDSGEDLYQEKGKLIHLFDCVDTEEIYNHNERRIGINLGERYSKTTNNKTLSLMASEK